jgi:N-acyl-D-amino-acid deacylase
MNFKIVIENGWIIDGTGNPWFKADIGINEDKIEAVGNLKETVANRRINASKLVVAPGFIDIHSHSDYNVLIDPRVESKVKQGVTTEVVGNCGSSAAPMNAEVRSYRDKYMRARLGDDFDFNWETMGDYLNLIDKGGVSFNVIAIVGQGTIRQNVMGYENREPTKSEIESMKLLVSEAMKDGAWGMSTGLIYTPSTFAKTDEIIELASVLAEYNGIYFSHIRGEGETLLEAIKEALKIGKKARVPVQIAHFKASGKPFWGKTKDSLKLIEEGRDHGVDVTFDQYPYVASSTGLAAFMPHWAQEGGNDRLLERLKDFEIRKKIAMDQSGIYREWSSVMVASAKNHPEYEGKRITEIAEIEGKEPIEAVFDLLFAENAQVSVVSFGISEEDLRRVLQSPFGMIGSDGSAVAPRGILGSGKPHPRYYGTFPRVLGYYVKEGVITLQEAIRKMTSAPAHRLSLKDRGLLRENFKADITIFDPTKVKDNATFVEPHQFASGIPYVVVNGEIVIDNGEHTGASPGRALRKNR